MHSIWASRLPYNYPDHAAAGAREMINAKECGNVAKSKSARGRLTRTLSEYQKVGFLNDPSLVTLSNQTSKLLYTFELSAAFIHGNERIEPLASLLRKR